MRTESTYKYIATGLNPLDLRIKSHYKAVACLCDVTEHDYYRAAVIFLLRKNGMMVILRVLFSSART